MRLEKGMVVSGEDCSTRPAPEGADLVERAREKLESMKELPASAAALQRALVMLDEPLCTNHRLERVLTSDPGAVTGLLRLANSAYFGVPGEVACAATAVRVVGHRRLRALLCHLIAGKLFEILRIDVPVVEQVRRKALAAAVVCSELGGDAEALRVAGLLYNVGELALASEFPAEFVEATDPVESFGISFETASEALLTTWCVPTPMAHAAKHWREAPWLEPSEPSQRVVDAVHIGGTLAEAWTEKATAKSASARLRSEPLERLDVAPRRLEGIYEHIGAGIQVLEEAL